jgi:hypothetical protein
MVVFDASVLLFVFDENTAASVPKAKERVDYLVKTLRQTWGIFHARGEEKIRA